ncbi:hypothetical protein ACFSCX_20450 [Bacillus salitolerans]|uniref:DUF304 domain-containing protein n=1 Tax=Bacillus salitolerans TaxID=1437434 RepID=A0ABW4LV03_9BACI
MVFMAKMKNGFLWILIIHCFFQMLLSEKLLNKVIYIVLASFILIKSIIKIRLLIKTDCLIYQTLLGNTPIITRCFYPNQIRKIQLKRMGWWTKGAVIKVNKGVHVKIVHFRPASIFEELERFSNEKNIVLEKTKDYKLLER